MTEESEVSNEAEIMSALARMEEQALALAHKVPSATVKKEDWQVLIGVRDIIII